MQEPYGAFTWYPVNDQPADKAFYDVKVDVPGRWVGISNGRLLARSTKAGRTRTAWRLTHPAASYLVTIAIGPYRRYDDTGPHGLPITYWVRPGDRRLLPVVRQAPEAIGWLEDRLGPLPSDRMGFVIVPDASGMETQDMITLGRESIQHDGGQVVAHELAHQWYGDAVTPSDWRDVWMNEGMATYLAEVNWSADHGAGSRQEILRGFADRASWIRDMWGPPTAYHPESFGEGDVYFIPALMWDTLRQRLGDDEFWSLATRWLQTHRFTSQDHDTLAAWWSKQSGEDLTPVFRAWLEGPREPAWHPG